MVLSSCKKKEDVTDAGDGASPKAQVVEIAEETQVAPPTTTPEPAIDPEIPELKVNKAAQVAILCYHDFVTDKAPTQMRIAVNHFRNQMQAIKDARLPVISLADFLKWRRGEKDIPDSSVMITIDEDTIVFTTMHSRFLKNTATPSQCFFINSM